MFVFFDFKRRREACDWGVSAGVGKGGRWERRGPRAGGEGRITIVLNSVLGCWIAIATCFKDERWPHSKCHKHDVLGVCYMLLRGVRVHVPLFVRVDTRFHPASKKCFETFV